MNKEYKLGVYLKPNGKLVTIEADTEKPSYIVLTGRVSNSPISKMLYKPKDRPLVGWTSSNLRLAWGPTAFLSKCEYLGEL